MDEEEAEEFSSIMEYYLGEYGVVVDLDHWETRHVVRVIELMDAELQRRHTDYAP